MRKGIIVGFLCRMTDSLYHNMKVSAVGRALTGYDAEQKILENSVLVGKVRTLGTKINTKTLKYAVARAVKDSVLVRGVLSLTDSLLRAPMAQYGIFLLLMGIFNILLFAFGDYLDFAETGVENLIAAMVCMPVSFPMIFSKKSLGVKICESTICEILLFRLLGFRYDIFYRIPRERARLIHIPVLLALAFAVFLIFVPLRLLITILVGIIALYSVLISPESGLVLVIISIPFAPSLYISLGVCYILICYLIKVQRGKRTLKFELNDYAVLAFGFVLIVGSFFSCNSAKSISYALRLIVYMSIYFLTVNMMKTKPWIRRMYNSILISTIVAVGVAILQKLAVRFEYFVLEDVPGGAVKGTFDYPEILSAFLLLGVFYMLAASIENSNRIRKAVCFLCFLCTVFCILLTQTPFALMAFLAGLLLFFLIYSNRVVIGLFSVILLIPFAKYILSSEMLLKINEFFASVGEGLAYRIKVWSIALKIARDYFLSGVGTGCFTDIYAKYAVEGMPSLPSAYNVYLQTIIENGIIGLFCIIALIMIFAQSNFSFFAKQENRRSIFANAGFCAVFSLFLLGFASNIWLEPKVFLTFWLVMGLTMAIKREGVKTSILYDKTMGGILVE